MSTSLAILEHIIQTAGAHEVAPYTPIIKGTLDYVDNLTLDSVKALYGVICALVIEDGEVVGGSLLSELVIMIRKQLTHMELRYRAYGVAGSVALLRWLGAKRVGSASGTDGTSASGSSSQRSSSARMGSGNQAVRHAIKILELVVKTCQHCMVGLYRDCLLQRYTISPSRFT